MKRFAVACESFFGSQIFKYKFKDYKCSWVANVKAMHAVVSTMRLLKSPSWDDITERSKSEPPGEGPRGIQVDLSEVNDSIAELEAEFAIYVEAIESSLASTDSNVETLSNAVTAAAAVSSLEDEHIALSSLTHKGCDLSASNIEGLGAAGNTSKGRAVGNIEADRHGMGPEIRSLRLTASLSLTPSLKVCHLWTFS
eukprot:jgi/Tetstr1/456950/TSEL_043620.t1